MRVIIALCVFLAVPAVTFADDPLSDAELDKAEAEYAAMRKKSDEREQKVVDEYLHNPDSEDAHSHYVVLMISKSQYPQARTAIEGWRKLNPRSKLLEAYEKQLVDLEGLKGAAVPMEMRKRHMQELMEAGKAEGLAKSGMSEEQMNNLFSGNKDDLMKFAEQMGNNKKAEMFKRYPNLCKQHESKNPMADMDVTMKLMNIKSKSGSDGLKKEYPNLLKEYANSEKMSESYAHFLVEEEQLDEAKKFSEAELKRFPESTELMVIRDELQKLDSVKSVEQRSDLSRSVSDRLMSLAMAQIDCIKQK